MSTDRDSSGVGILFALALLLCFMFIVLADL